MCTAESVQAGTDAHRKDIDHSWAAYGSGFCILLVSINNLDAKILKDYSWDLTYCVQENKPCSQLLCSHCCRHGIVSWQTQEPASSRNPSTWQLHAAAHPDSSQNTTPCMQVNTVSTAHTWHPAGWKVCRNLSVCPCTLWSTVSDHTVGYITESCQQKAEQTTWDSILAYVF